MKTKTKPGRIVKQLREIAKWLEYSRAMDVELALDESHVQFACIEYLHQQSDAIQWKKHMEFHCKTLRRIAMSRKRKCSLLPMAHEVLRANDEVIEQLGKTIAAIRREYRELWRR